MDTNSSVPPLEDVPSVLEKLNLNSQTKTITNKPREIGALTSNKTEAVKEFGGMKKGFLCGISKKSRSINMENPKIKTTTDSDIPFIKAAPANSNLVLKEVQDAMSIADPFSESLEEFPKKVASHPTVSHVLSDPQWIEILDEFQKDPEKAMKKYNDNAKVRSTMQELCSILGDSFLHMSGPPKNEEEALSKRLLEDPKLKDALTDPFIEQIMEHSKHKRNDKINKLIERATPSQKSKLQMLVDYGLFSLS